MEKGRECDVDRIFGGRLADTASHADNLRLVTAQHELGQKGHGSDNGFF